MFRSNRMNGRDKGIMEMKKNPSARAVYICPVCHCVSARAGIHHRRRTTKCDAGIPGDERSKPLYDESGNLISRAPLWWIDACKMSTGKIRAKKKVGEK